MDCSQLFRLHEKVIYNATECEVIEFIGDKVLLRPKLRWADDILVLTSNI